MQNGDDRAGLRYRLLAAAALIWLWGWGLRVHRGGADYDHYVQYARRLIRGDLLLRGSDLSPTGVIVCHHSIGPGLSWSPLMAAAKAMKAKGPDRTFAFVTHFLQGFALLALMVAVMRRAGVSAFQNVAALICVAFGSPLFYYWLLSISSELLSALTLFGLFAFLYLRARDEGRVVFYAYAGLLAGAAVTARPNNAVTAALVLSLLAYRAGRRQRCGDVVKYLAVLGGACLLAMGPWFVTNWLFTGSPFSTPFTQRLPSGRWVWFDWSRVHLGEELFSYWHGWIVYSPIVLLALGAAVWRSSERAPQWRRRPALGADLTAWLPWVFSLGFVCQILLFAASRCWWMGLGTFGGRQFTPAAPFVTLALAWLFKKLRCACLWCWPVLLAIGCALWTYGLYFDHFGCSNFTQSYAELATAQARTLWAFAHQPVFAAPFGCLILLSGLTRKRVQWQWLFALGLGLLMARCLMPYYALLRKKPLPAHDKALAWFLAAMTLAIMWALTRTLRRRPRTALWICFGLTVAVDVFVFVCAARAKAIARQAVPKHEFIAPFEAKEWIESFKEYRRIRGYADEKRDYAAAIREFLTTQRSPSRVR